MQRIATAGIFILLVLLPAQASAQSYGRQPIIIPRAKWGADELLGVVRQTEVVENVHTSEALVDHSHSNYSLSEKEKRCNEAIHNYPEDFATARTVADDGNGYNYLWPRRYSNQVKLIVVHHTGEIETEERKHMTGPQRVRAIYKAHTVSNGWGDIGYHYLIDKDGVIYEGRAGGHGVVGAHVYCANVGTVGIALIGNYQAQYPPEAQLESLEWLLNSVAEEYDINLRGRTEFQGKLLPTVVTHRDLAATQCAGRRMEMLMPTIRRLAAAGRYDISPLSLQRTAQRTTEYTPATVGDNSNAIIPVGETSLRLLPRGAATVQIRYEAHAEAVQSGERIATVEKSNVGISIWQERNGSRIRVQSDIRAEHSIRRGESITMQLHFLAPRKPGTYTVQIGEITYTLEVGMR